MHLLKNSDIVNDYYHNVQKFQKVSKIIIFFVFGKENLRNEYFYSARMH